MRNLHDDSNNTVQRNRVEWKWPVVARLLALRVRQKNKQQQLEALDLRLHVQTNNWNPKMTKVQLVLWHLYRSSRVKSHQQFPAVEKWWRTFRDNSWETLGPRCIAMYGQSHPLFVCLGNWPGFCHSPLYEETEEPAFLSCETWRKKWSF